MIQKSSATNNMKIKEYYPEGTREKLIKRIDDFLESETGFLIMVDEQTDDGKPRITDLYKGMCVNCVVDIVASTAKDAHRNGLLAMHSPDNKHKH